MNDEWYENSSNTHINGTKFFSFDSANWDWKTNKSTGWHQWSPSKPQESIYQVQEARIRGLETSLLKLQQTVEKLEDLFREVAMIECENHCERCIPCRSRDAIRNSLDATIMALQTLGE